MPLGNWWIGEGDFAQRWCLSSTSGGSRGWLGSRGSASACGELFEAAFLDVGVDEGDDDGLILGAHGLHRPELQLELVVGSPLVDCRGGRRGAGVNR